MPERRLLGMLKLFLGALCVVTLAACEEDPDEARFKLGQLGYPFNAFSLLIAAESNDHVALRYLTLAGMDPNTVIDWGVIREERDRTGTGRELTFMHMWGLRANAKWHVRALNVAAAHGFVESVEVLLDAGADTEAVDSGGNTALMRATEAGHEDVVELLLDADAEQVANEDGDTPLTRAVEREDIVLIEVLLDAGGDLTVVNNVGLSVLAQATTVTVVDALIDAGIDVNAQFFEIEEGDGLTALMAATVAGNLAVVRRLLDAGADPNLQSRNGDTALMMAVSRRTPIEDDVAIVEALLGAGADPNVRNNDGVTALGFAISEDRLDLARILLDAGADISLADYAGVTPLIRLLGEVHRPTDDEMLALVKEFLAAGADSNGQTEEGVTAVSLAFAKSYYSVVRTLFDAGAEPRGRSSPNGIPFIQQLVGNYVDPDAIQWAIDALDDVSVLDAQNNGGGTALMKATIAKRVDAVRLLLDAGADTNVANDAGETALMFAATAGNLDFVRLLLDAGADPNARSNEGFTVLMMAASEGVDVVRALLDAGADPEAQTDDGKTAEQFVGRWSGPRQRAVIAALREAIAQKQALEATEDAETVAPPGSPPAAPAASTEIVGDGEDVLERLTHETYVGGMKRRGMKIYGLSRDGNWCATTVVFKVVAASASVYSDGTFNFFMKRFGERINEAQFCPAARAAELYGYTETGSEPVFSGTASAEGGWAVN